MSLNRAQRERTAAELAANLEASGLSPIELSERTGLPVERVEAALDIEGGDPVDVWHVRDALETAVRESGAPLTPFSVLTEENRAAAAGWFGVRDRR